MDDFVASNDGKYFVLSELVSSRTSRSESRMRDGDVTRCKVQRLFTRCIKHYQDQWYVKYYDNQRERDQIRVSFSKQGFNSMEEYNGTKACKFGFLQYDASKDLVSFLTEWSIDPIEGRVVKFTVMDFEKFADIAEELDHRELKFGKALPRGDGVELVPLNYYSSQPGDIQRIAYQKVKEYFELIEKGWRAQMRELRFTHGFF